MEAIYIPHLLKAPQRKLEIIVRDAIARLDTLTPVKGTIVVRHGGNFLEVTAKAETIVTMSCDRCLQNYNHRLQVDTSELIWLEAEIQTMGDLPTEREVSIEDLSETLPPDGHFDPESWLYEQFSLAMPFRKECGPQCPGVATISTQTEPHLDTRWSSLAALKDKFKVD
ncbi:MAG: DUF177 domain-containing protein [Pleurocapsa sp.]